MNEQKTNVTVVGAGLPGALMSLFLAKSGYQVDLFEVRPDLRRNISAGRSFNLAISYRGIHALKQIGIFDQIQSELIPLKGRMIHGVTGSPYFQPYGTKENEMNYSVSRSTLNTLLLNATEKYPNLTIHFSHQCMDYDFERKTILFSKLDEADREIKFPSKHVIGADGAFSHLRKSMLRMPRFNFSQENLDWGYKELNIPPGPGGKHLIETGALHIWPRTNFMLIALPNRDGSFTCTLFLPYEGKESFESLGSNDKVETFFETYFPDAKKIMPTLLADYDINPTGSMINVECSPWNHGGDLVLLGDAAHSMTPFFGQGMNSAFEDCMLLDQTIAACGGNFEMAFATFSKQRKKDTDAICLMSKENFIEMRDNVGNETFKKKKQLEHELELAYPEYYRSRYARVSFSREPYSEVYAQGIENEKSLEEIMKLGPSIKEIDPEKIKNILKKHSVKNNHQY